MVKQGIEEIKAAWQKETDEWVLKAATTNINEYPEEIRIIIHKEAIKRGLLKCSANRITMTEKAEEVLADAEEIDPKVFSVRVVKTYIVIVVVGTIFALFGYIFGLPEAFVISGAAFFTMAAADKIWQRRKNKL